MLYRFRTLVVLAVFLPVLTGCLFRTHKVERRLVNVPPMSATLEELVEKINSQASMVSSLNATVDIVTSAAVKKNQTSETKEVRDFQEIRGYVLLRKPAMLRMIGLFPVVRNRMFDMVSDGDRFRLSIPPKNKFIVGANEVKTPSKEPLENLRPSHILDALLLKPINPENEIAVLEYGEEEVKDTKTKKMAVQPAYVVTVIHRDEQNHWALSRKILFSRTDLMPRRQTIYDKQGNVATIANYDNFSDYNGVMFPNIIQIERPQEEYSIQLGVVKMRLNEPLKDEQFELAQPAGSQLQNLDTKNAETPQRTQVTQPQSRPESR